MGKARTDRNGHTREQRLIHENQQLKKQISGLRKALARIDLDRYDMVKEMIQDHYKEEREEQGKEILESIRKSWACRECGDGTMEIYIYNRGPGTFYYRICSNAPSCMNRTLAKPYTPGVKGVIRPEKE